MTQNQLSFHFSNYLKNCSLGLENSSPNCFADLVPSLPLSLGFNITTEDWVCGTCLSFQLHRWHRLEDCDPRTKVQDLI
jgi:hypothetical protein